MPTSFSCPSCDAVLRITSPVAAGKKVKCPKCETIFLAPRESPPEQTSVPDSVRPLPARTRRSAIDDEADDDDDSERITPAAARGRRDGRLRDDDIDEEEDFDRPRRVSKKSRKTAKGANSLLIGLTVGGILLFLGAGAFAAWVWPGFLRGEAPTTSLAKGTGEEDMLVYVPPNFPLVIGVDLATIRKKAPGLDAQFDQLANIPGLPKGLRQTLPKTDQLVLAVQLQGGDAPGLLIAKTRDPYTLEEMRVSFDGGQARSAHGRTYYELPKVDKPAGMGAATGPDRRWFLGMPNDRILLAGDITQEELETTLASERPRIVDIKVEAVRPHQKAAMWFFLDLDSPIQRALDLGMAGAAKTYPALKNFHKASAGLKSLAGSIKLGDEVHVDIVFTSGQDLSAAGVTRAVQSLWESDGKGAFAAAAVGLRIQGFPSIAQALSETSKSMKFETRGTQSWVSAGITKNTFDKAIQEIQRLVNKQMADGRIWRASSQGRSRPNADAPAVPR